MFTERVRSFKWQTYLSRAVVEVIKMPMHAYRGGGGRIGKGGNGSHGKSCCGAFFLAFSLL